MPTDIDAIAMSEWEVCELFGITALIFHAVIKALCKSGLLTVFLLNKTLKWVPQIKGMLNLERQYLAIGFNQEQTAVLMMGKPLEYSGELYSEEHKRKFITKEVKANVVTDKGKFVLTIDLQPIGDWFKAQLEKFSQTVKQSIQLKGRSI